MCVIRMRTVHLHNHKQKKKVIVYIYMYLAIYTHANYTTDILPIFLGKTENLAACRVTAPPSAPAAAGMFRWRRLSWRTLMWSYMV